jgi:hypothetical protein
MVYGDAWVYGDAQVSEDARVYGYAEVYGSAKVYGSARVFGGARITMNLPFVMRSDGYTFFAFPCADGTPRLTAGCRYFTFAEAREHWQETRGGTPLGDETIDIINFLERAIGRL